MTAPLLANPALALAADVVSDLEKVRIANQNRLRQMIRSVEDSDGEERGLGLLPPGFSKDSRTLVDDIQDAAIAITAAADSLRQRPRCPEGWVPDVWNLTLIIVMMVTAEKDAIRNLERIMKQHPLGPWAAQQKGVGNKQLARLLAATGDPYIRPEITLADGTVDPSRPRRGPAELWAYCGYHVLTAVVGGTEVGVAPRRKRGEHANWSADAKMRAYLVAESCIKQKGTPYRDLYDMTRIKHADALHRAECLRCGPKGSPAQPGSPLSDGHKHARGLRAVAKEVLKELWREARRLHHGGTDPDGPRDSLPPLLPASSMARSAAGNGPAKQVTSPTGSPPARDTTSPTITSPTIKVTSPMITSSARDTPSPMNPPPGLPDFLADLDTFLGSLPPLSAGDDRSHVSSVPQNEGAADDPSPGHGDTGTPMAGPGGE
jgi:hypothetical protein